MARGKKKITDQSVAENENKPFIPTIRVKAEIDSGEWDNDGLTFRQKRFVEAMTGPAGGEQTKAAEMAGYASENRNALRATASYLLTLPNVQKAIALALAARRMTPKWASDRLGDIANADMANFITIDENGQPKIDFKKAETIGAIGQIKEFDPTTGKLKLHDPTPALTTILKMYGLVTDKHEHLISEKRDEALSVLTVEELQLLRQIRAKIALPSGN